MHIYWRARQTIICVKISCAIYPLYFKGSMQNAIAIQRIETKYRSLVPSMDERERRQWAASEAKAYGWGGITAVAHATGLSLPSTEECDGTHDGDDRHGWRRRRVRAARGAGAGVHAPGQGRQYVDVLSAWLARFYPLVYHGRTGGAARHARDGDGVSARAGGAVDHQYAPAAAGVDCASARGKAVRVAHEASNGPVGLGRATTRERHGAAGQGGLEYGAAAGAGGVLGEGVLAVRDRALLLLGFAGALRRSELVGVDVDDVTFLDEGAVVVHDASEKPLFIPLMAEYFSAFKAG